MPKILIADEIRELSFRKTKDEYLQQNIYAERYVDEFMSGVNPQDIVSDHEAKRLNGLQSFVNGTRYFMALGMVPFESEDTTGFADLVVRAVKENNPQLLAEVEFPYEFPDKGLRSTHFEVANPLDKGTGEKIFISLPDPKYFKSVEQVLIAEDQEIFSNEFSKRGVELIEKLELEEELSEEESRELIEDYMQEFSSRKIPMKASAYEAISKAEMINLPEGKEPHPEILAIGLVFSGVRNHCTLPLEGQRIVNTPDELESIGVPKGNPPVQFKDGLVQTSSGGMKQKGEVIPDSQEVNDILEGAGSADEKRAALQSIEAIEVREFNHEYVEYATRAMMAVVEVKRGGENLQETIPVWQMADGTYRSALEGDRDHEGLESGKYDKNPFNSYVIPVEVKEVLKDSKGNPTKYPGFKADNATNIFLGTSAGS